MKKNLLMLIGLLYSCSIYSQIKLNDGVWLPQRYLSYIKKYKTENEAYADLKPIQALFINKGKVEVLLYEQDIFSISLKKKDKNTYLIIGGNINIDNSLGTIDMELKNKKAELKINNDNSILITFYHKNKIVNEITLVRFSKGLYQNEPLSIFYHENLKGNFSILDNNAKIIDKIEIKDRYKVKSAIFSSIELEHHPGGNLYNILPTFSIHIIKGNKPELVKLEYKGDTISLFDFKKNERKLRYYLIRE